YIRENPIVVSTDPPYYDNIGYADLSDFFYVWLRRSLAGILPELFATVMAPTSIELIASPYRHPTPAEAEDFCEKGLFKAFVSMRGMQHPDIPLTLFYAFKQAESESRGNEGRGDGIASTGWETMLAALLGSGFSIQGTWPMRTELTGNLKK